MYLLNIIYTKLGIYSIMLYTLVAMSSIIFNVYTLSSYAIEPKCLSNNITNS